MVWPRKVAAAGKPDEYLCQEENCYNSQAHFCQKILHYDVNRTDESFVSMADVSKSSGPFKRQK